MKKDQRFDPTNLNRLIEERGENVPSIHRKTNIPVTTLYDWCNGRTIPKANTLKKVASVLGVGMEELIE